MALLDFDTYAAYRAFPERARFLVRTFRIPFHRCRIRRFRTQRGWHVVVRYLCRRCPPPTVIVAVQAILGSDSKRETFNLYRAVKLSDAPLPWREMGRWNTLYARKCPMEKTRMQFIPTLRRAITVDLMRQGVPERIVADAFEQWDRGEEPRTPHERGCFEVFRAVEADIRKAT